MNLFIPKELDEIQTIDFLDYLWERMDEKDICLNFSSLQFVRPFGTLLLAESIRDFVGYRKKKALRTTLSPCSNINRDRSSALSFLRHFRFFEYIDAPCGESSSPTHSDRGYIPISKIMKDELIKKSGCGPIQEAIQTYSKDIASSIVQERNDYIENMITYCFREIIRNTFEHAEIDWCVIMATNLWHAGEFEIALADRGVGILQSIKKRHDVKITEEAIDKALEPGISGAVIDDDNIWGNSGFGLYILSELGRTYGSFSIYSSGVLISLSGDEKKYTDIQISGTGVKLRLNVEHADYFPNITEQIIKKGEEFFTSKYGVKKKASKMSKLL